MITSNAMIQPSKYLTLARIGASKFDNTEMSIYYDFGDSTNHSVYFDVDHFKKETYDNDIIMHKSIPAERYFNGKMNKIRVITIETIAESLKNSPKRKELLKKLMAYNTEHITKITAYHDNMQKYLDKGNRVVKYVGDIETSTGIYDTFVDSKGEFYHFHDDVQLLFNGLATLKKENEDSVVNGVTTQRFLTSRTSLMTALNNVKETIKSLPIPLLAIDEIFNQYDKFWPPIEMAPLNTTPQAELALRRIVDNWIQKNPAEGIKPYDYNVKFMIDCTVTIHAYGLSSKMISSGTTFSCGELNGMTPDDILDGI